MPTPLVKPGFGPTLPQSLAPRWRRASPVRRVLAAAALVAALVLLVAGWAVLREGAEHVVVREPVAFNLRYDSSHLERERPMPGDSLLLSTRAGARDPQSLAVRALRMPAYRGNSSGTLPIVAARMVGAMAPRYPGFVLRAEGRANVNKQPGYQIQFQFTRDGRTWYGRRTLLLAEEVAQREGVDVTLLTARSASITTPDDVGSVGPIKLPYRSLRLGTEGA